MQEGLKIVLIVVAVILGLIFVIWFLWQLFHITWSYKSTKTLISKSAVDSAGAPWTTTLPSRLLMRDSIVYMGNNKYVVYDPKKMPQAASTELSYELYVFGP